MATRKKGARKKVSRLKPPDPSDEEKASGLYDEIPKNTGEFPEGERVIEQTLAEELAPRELSDREKDASPEWRKIRRAGSMPFYERV